MNRRDDRPDLWALIGLVLLAVLAAAVILAASSPFLLESEIVK
ncbi:hypothetical protein SAMN05421874_12875 [Nonomuraea maritima]|uniref:Uncharacterized protein n=1 Tax=Nonomuraea maritima TaxID=683260 RepID=A0A1G9MM05_9ACTN|nr:hypothetical protein [Nonomuraea maritima]SDL74685.1 hypothetical protein SAMN05421874_12875 [Nonomuraea maritima]